MSVAEGIRKFIKSVIILFYYRKTFKPSHHLAIRLKAYEKDTVRAASAILIAALTAEI